ncbi:MAG TPA: methyl-accepting chemotaxis protein [Burkholderiaceae bacterium]|nr:methyl-accepting chemotaxis protein [Burkholderiaceae bacterium]HMX09937.1 methyl-accepting chemotaxis protein [Burkholderiaceae bacterium]HMY99770.1 methyl-accepting chemotaxis protein [Burkholderiaceae bacterium]HNB42873.1 methyl-accepting chemotaxis protein [Burkholderiaceae bacterium]HNG78545.1 methyl-accepting chemotaxis protein [Burkholderiaceae bacterium]
MTTASPPAQPSATGRWRDGIDLNELRAVWRFHGVWGPGMLVLRNLTLVWKAVVIFALMALPIGLVGFGYLKNMSDRLQEVDQQLACVDGLQALSRASLAMREARFRSVRAGLGLAPDADVGASLVAEASAWKDLQANPLLAQGDVRPVWAVFNQVRATSLAHLAQRKPFVASVPGKAEEDYRHAAGHLVKVLLDAGSGGALPDRGLRALMAGGVVALPELIEVADRLADVVVKPRDRGQLTAERLHDSAVALGMARQELDEIRADLTVADAAGQAVVRSELLPALQRIESQLDRLASLQTADGAGVVEALPPVLPQLVEKVYGMQVATLGALHRQLDAQRTALWAEMRLELLVLLACAGATLYAIVCAFRVVHGGLLTLRSHAARMAEGDFSQIPFPRGRDEVGQALGSLRVSLLRMNELFATVSRGVSSLAHAVHEVADGNAGLAQRTQTADQGIHRMTDRVLSFSEKMDACGREVDEAVDHARAMRIDAARSKKSMSGLRERMDTLQCKSHEIGDIIGLIDGLAHQTRMLALNASVEAARAGEAGKGFAVVAAEVRALAQRSAEAATQVGGIIAASTAEIQDGHALSERASEVVTLTEERIAAINERMNRIVAVLRESTAEAEEVLVLAREVGSATEGNVQLMNQLTDASVALRGQGDTLETAMAQFKLA